MTKKKTRTKNDHLHMRIATSKLDEIKKAAAEDSQFTGYRITASNWVERWIDKALAERKAVKK